MNTGNPAQKKYIPFWIKLFFCYSTLIVCIGFLILAVIYPRITTHSKKEIRSQMTKQADQVITTLEYQLDQMRGMYIGISIDETLQKLFIGSDHHSLETRDYIIQKFETMTNIWGNTTFVYLYDTDSELLYDSRSLSTITMVDPSCINHARDHEGMFKFQVIEDTNHSIIPTKVLTIGGALRMNIIGEPVGYFCVNLSLKDVSSLLLSPVYQAGTLQILLDGDGNHILGDQIILPDNISSYNGTITLDDIEYLIVSSHSTKYNYTHYILTPTKEAYSDLNLLTNVMITTCIISILISILASYIMARQMTSPIKRLTKMVEDYQCDADVPVQLEDLNLSNEFHVLNDGLIHMSERINTLINDVYRHQIMHQQLELKTLYRAINPHFIYNILDTIQWELRLKKTDLAIETLYAFSNYLRNTLILKQDTTKMQSIRTSVDGYCKLQALFYDDVEYEIHIPEDLDEYTLPSMLVLPIVENCFTHAFPDTMEGQKKIIVNAYTDQDYLIITVQDTGIGISEEDLNTIRQVLVNPLSYKLKEDSTRFFAIKNMQSRILLSCGEKYGMEIDSNEHGTKVTLFLPLQKNDAESPN